MENQEDSVMPHSDQKTKNQRHSASEEISKEEWPGLTMPTANNLLPKQL